MAAVIPVVVQWVRDHLITGPRWAGPVPDGSVSAPHSSVLVIGRIFVVDDSDLPAAHELARQIRLTPATS